MKLAKLIFVSSCIAFSRDVSSVVSSQPPPIEIRFSKADLVFDGTIVSASKLVEQAVVGNDPKVTFLLAVNVNQAFKGIEVRGQTLHVELSALQTVPIENEEYLFFVGPAPTDNIFKAASEGAVIPFHLTSIQIPESVGIEGLRNALRSELTSEGPAVNLSQTLSILAQFSTIDKLTEDQLNKTRMTKSADFGIQSLTILAKGSKNKEVYTSELISQVANSPGQPYTHPEDLFGVIAFTDNPSDLPNLEKIVAESSSHILRLAAMNTIRESMSAQSMPFLASMLYSSDSQIQYDAVISLAELTTAPSDYAPFLPRFNRDPDRYLNYWKEWTKQRGLQ